MAVRGGWLSRAKDEYKYYTRRPWTLESVGQFWDTVEEYDDINKKLYPYYKRFTNSELLLRHSNVKMTQKISRVLDIQTRSGQGTKFWSKRFQDANFTCVDFSDGLLRKAQKRLKGNERVEFKKVLDTSFDLSKKYQLILCYETVEHIYDYAQFIKSLSNHLVSDGIIILTCPNVVWEPVHWITAIVGFNHSEGPHRFIEKDKLEVAFEDAGLGILAYNTTILLPFSNPISVKLDRMLTKSLPLYLKENLMLRHSYILGKK